tara:strand:+ start:156 stop:272 length:117 start_codon:yes stop_codon:yes gene_type:complete
MAEKKKTKAKTKTKTATKVKKVAKKDPLARTGLVRAVR